MASSRELLISQLTVRNSSRDVPAQGLDDRVFELGGRSFSVYAERRRVHCVPVDDVLLMATQDEWDHELEVNRLLNSFLGETTVLVPNFPPPNLKQDEALSVLDCGCGSGAWIDSFLQEYEEAEVTGVDLFLNGQSESTEDSEDEWFKERWDLNISFRLIKKQTALKRDRFHLINSRLLTGGIYEVRWDGYLAELHQMLRRGGWLQMVEIELPPQSGVGNALGAPSSLGQWWDHYRAAMTRVDSRVRKNLTIGQELRVKLRSAGFGSVNVESKAFPVGAWHPDFDEDLGKDMLPVMEHMLDSLGIWPFRRFSQLTAEQCDALITRAKAELRDPAKKWFLKV
ncbi:hypothetical protein K431DRAFT_327130 [Polychaeton citri CBS 116435]|uniref:Methyltransferase domain-containing protein n=1 Tax=Polychaeton citri CBS 116435 TaxID=1314669 RepID=A0A9P4UNM0_9PEZI|nr:hypothetical protein K431DRAFT_327130 [Polychaeton citri CBS 116435]